MKGIKKKLFKKATKGMGDMILPMLTSKMLPELVEAYKRGHEHTKSGNYDPERFELSMSKRLGGQMSDIIEGSSTINKGKIPEGVDPLDF